MMAIERKLLHDLRLYLLFLSSSAPHSILGAGNATALRYITTAVASACPSDVA